MTIPGFIEVQIGEGRMASLSMDCISELFSYDDGSGCNSVIGMKNGHSLYVVNTYDDLKNKLLDEMQPL